MDLSGSHAFICDKVRLSNNLQTARHNSIQRVLMQMVYKEPLALLHGLRGQNQNPPVLGIFPLKPNAQPPVGGVLADIFETVQDQPQHRVLLDVTVTFPQASKLPHSTTIEGHGAAAKAAEERKDRHYAKYHVIPEGGMVPIAFETYGTLGTRGDQHLRKRLRDKVRPVEWLEPVPESGPKFIDHGGRYSIYLRKLREHLAVTLQLGNCELLKRWIEISVRPGGAAPPNQEAGDADAAEAGG